MIVGLLGAASFLIILLVVTGQSDDIGQLEEDSAEKTAAIERLKEDSTEKLAAVEALADQVDRLCRNRPCEPIIDPDELPEIPEVPAVDHISQEQVELAIASYCTDNYPVCVGPRGRPGEDGRNGRNGEDGLSVTPEMVAAAVATYCDPRGQCIGPTGADGRDGATGDTGPPPSDGQVLAAVTTYCDAHDNCRGPQGLPGNDGQNGADGQDGRGIASLECDSVTPFTLTVHWSDGTTETFTCGGVEQP